MGRLPSTSAMLVFISHSTKPDAPRDNAYLEAVEKALQPPEFTVLLDRKTLESGQEWPRHLSEYMAQCHIAVVLFSRNALESEWVARELNNLDWRRALDKDFLLLPVALEGVSPTEVRGHKRFSATDLRRWQFVPPGSPEEVAQRILESCRKHLALRPSPTPMERLVRKLTGMLEGARKVELEDAAHQLGLSIPAWDPSGCLTLADALARQLLLADCGRLHAFVRTLAPILEPTQVRRLVRCLKPLWVDERSAGVIPAIAGDRDEPRSLGLNGRKLPEFTARSYLDRAYWGDVAVDLILVDGAVGQHPFQEIQGQIEAYLTARGYDLKEPEDAFETIRTLFFVLLPGPVPEPEVLEQLQAHYPRMTFILTTGVVGHEDPRVASHHRLITLEPALDPRVERAAWNLQKDFETILKNIEG